MVDPMAAAAAATLTGAAQRKPVNRSAALSAAAQRLNAPKPPGGQQIQGRDVTTENGQTGITGAHGGFQQLGQAAQAKLRGFGGGVRTPPIMDPAAKPPGPGPNVFHPTNPAAGGDLQIMDGAPGTAVPGGAPTMPFGGRTPSFGNPNQTLGVGGPQDEVQAAQHMGANIPPGVANAMRQQQAGGASPDTMGGENNIMQAMQHQGGGPSLGPVTNYGPANVDGGMPPPGPLGSMPGSSQKPLLRGFGGPLPTKPLAAPSPGGMGSSIWNRIAGGGGFTPRPTQLQRNNMAAY